MLTLAITNLSSTLYLGGGADGPVGTDPYTGGTTVVNLPDVLNWVSIAPSGSKSVAIRYQDLEQPALPLSGFTVADMLQQMVQLGQISVSFSAITESAAVLDVDGTALHADV